MPDVGGIIGVLGNYDGYSLPTSTPTNRDVLKYCLHLRKDLIEKCAIHPKSPISDTIDVLIDELRTFYKDILLFPDTRNLKRFE